MQREVQLVVEGELDGVVLRKLVEHSANGLSVCRVLPMRGCEKIRSDIQRFKNASNVIPHIILADLDLRDCALGMIKDWGVDGKNENLLFRVAVREVEAWLLADREGMSTYLNLPLVKMPMYPELEKDPKQTLLNLVRKCKKRRLIEELVPPVGSSASIGPLYNARMGDFVRDYWNIERAVTSSDSLLRAVRRISTF